ncbi:hypothetical protein CH63R_09839 [Colletotrichum higginsianum IMI 349063]|uniref:Apple domain-containing protein n=2 Tax=Colletotrichum higginsianum TaxID=80884 RepID=A0A1B7Y121_COLHI|nr:uncharacterized protein CH63R_09839 [Colletotrichum higginsianum IMI 349063]OBR05719.1 hypothetical protein CH63R_09839 [Colletotrichum higginsianum IMI 349063]TIC90529.1 hypothetical protein CH35J_011806 [Colletotrichum higginsianum]
MQTFTIATILAIAAAAQAGPLAIRDVCNSAPSGPTTANVSPRSQPSAATAEACQKLCEADAGCQSFVFGLPESGTTPLCQLYAVPASQVPKQSNANLMVFDKACSGVPTTAPTKAGSDNNGSTGGNDNQNGGQQPKKRTNVCGAAPVGPATSNPTPILSRQDITDQDACLALCKQTTGCQAIEFGKPSANEPVQCRLFDTPASNLPAPTNGQTFVAFDVGC